MGKLKTVPVDRDYLLILAHRKWIKTRDPKDGDRFAAMVAEMSRPTREAPHE